MVLTKKRLILIAAAVFLVIAIIASFNMKKSGSRTGRINVSDSGGTVQIGESQKKLKIEELVDAPDGAAAKPGDYVLVNYTGMLAENGSVFDSNTDRENPSGFYIGMGKVIKGWDKGIVDMKVGEKRRLTVPPDLAYGSAGYGDKIPPNATLIFDVELLGIK